MAFVDAHELITNDVPLTIVPTLKIPRAAAPVEPTDILVKKIIELEVTALVETIAVPDTSVTVPKELAPAEVVVPTEVLNILLPAVPNTKLPFVAVIAPSVAVSAVPAVIAALEETAPVNVIPPEPERIVVEAVVFVVPNITTFAAAPVAIDSVFTPVEFAILIV